MSDLLPEHLKQPALADDSRSKIIGIIRAKYYPVAVVLCGLHCRDYQKTIKLGGINYVMWYQILFLKAYHKCRNCLSMIGISTYKWHLSQ